MTAGEVIKSLIMMIKKNTGFKPFAWVLLVRFFSSFDKNTLLLKKKKKKMGGNETFFFFAMKYNHRLLFEIFP